MRIPIPPAGAFRQLALLTGLVGRILRTGPPPRLSTEQRLASLPTRNLPLDGPVEITWNAHLIPSITAGSDRDLATALGAVHAHLRLAQMEAMRALALGRVAELVGPSGIKWDHALRLMRLGQAVPEMIARMPAPTRLWAEAFLAGVNHHLEHASALPYEMRLFGAPREPWTLEHLLTVSRLAATDISWLVFARLLRGASVLSEQAWERLWPAMQGGDALPWPTRDEEAALALVRGSNSAAVAASRSRRGAGLIASDPHLPITLPPLWLVAGLHAPGLDVVGLMIPGLPVVALGRNRHIAWGGTNLHAASSELIEAGGETITQRQETIRVRGRKPATLTFRDTRFGPVISDGLLFRADRPLALRWVGHRPSDEMGAMLAVMRADSLDAFRAALRGFAIPGQTMVGVEAVGTGRAGRVIVAHLPRRRGHALNTLTTAPEDAWSLDDLVVAQDFPPADEAIVVSANDRPPETPVPVGFFFSPPDRARRLRALLEGAVPVGVESMRGVQRDVMHGGALALRDALLSRLRPGPRERKAVAALRAWDGAYTAASEGALVLEVLVGALAHHLIPPAELDLLASIWTGRALIAHRITEADPVALARALRKAARTLRRYRNWGGIHRLAPRHPLGRLPLVGRWFRIPTLPAAGGNDTLNKTSHGLVTGRHMVTFGACARHVSDLADPDANWFVLLGGQDGWLGSANSADQVPLWQRGEAIQVPLRPEAIESESTRSWLYRTQLLP